MDNYTSKSGSLIGNDGGRLAIDVETIEEAWVPGDVIYGSVTDYILDIKGLSLIHISAPTRRYAIG